MFPSWEYTQLKKKKEPKPVFHKENTSNDLLGRHRPPCPTGAQERSVSGCAAGRRGPGPPRAGRRQHPHASREREQRTAGKKSSFFPEFAPAAVTVAPACRLGSHQEWGVHKGCGAWAPPRRACALTPETPCAKQTPAASSGVWSSSFTALSLGQSPHRDQDRNPGWGLLPSSRLGSGFVSRPGCAWPQAPVARMRVLTARLVSGAIEGRSDRISFFLS